MPNENPVFVLMAYTSYGKMIRRLSGAFLNKEDFEKAKAFCRLSNISYRHFYLNDFDSFEMWQQSFENEIMDYFARKIPTINVE